MPAILIRCDGNHEIGMGHVSRCLALADALRDRERCTVTFAMHGTETAGAAAVRDAGYTVDAVAANGRADYGNELQAIAAARGAAALVVDVRDGLSRASLDAIRARGITVVSIDDAADRRLAADLAFYPPVPQVEELDWSTFAGRRYVGWEFVLLRREFSGAALLQVSEASSRARAVQPSETNSGARAVQPSETNSGARAFQASETRSADSLALHPSPAIDVLVTMGGSDPAGMTEFALCALDLLPMPLAVCVVLGPAFARAEGLIGEVARSHHAIRVARAPASLAPLMRTSRLAVVSFGVSAYELAACGVPAVHICLTDDHARSSSAFAREGAAVTAGVFGRLTAPELADPLRRLMGRADRRGHMAKRASQLVDGRGADRVAAVIVAAL